ncbi:glycosyltransferase [Serinibacter arcticus]|nr:glycosyltransferase [Serinibacter arcticus]
MRLSQSTVVPRAADTTADELTLRNPTNGGRMIFISVASQRDNLGDSLLRRPLIAAGQACGTCHVYVGEGAEDWTNLGLRSVDRLYTDRRKWMFALARSAVLRRTTLLLNAGELLPDRRFLVSRALLLPVILASRARGGRLIHAGFGLRDPNAKVPAIARLIASLSDVATWRDEASRSAAGIGTVAPDWAFGEGASPEHVSERHHEQSDRRVLALSLRGDRPPPPAAWLDEVRRVVSEDLDATVVVVVQVRRDGDRNAWLAKELGAELIDWPEEADHAEQERRVRSVYSRATWIGSNRLHAVIMAVTEGAVPLDLVPDQSQKVPRALAVVDLALLPAQGARERVKADQTDVRGALASGRKRLTGLATAISRVSGGKRRRRYRVLHTVSAPDRTTRYARHMAATEDYEVRPVFLSWRNALTRPVDAVHVHWPEHLVPAGSSVRARHDRALAAALIRRIQREKIPVIRTVHNLTPHQETGDRTGAHLREALTALTRAEIHLVPNDPQVSAGSVHLVPHGSYREPYADVVGGSPLPARVLHFGRIEGYKGVPELLAAAAESEVGELRIVGSPSDRDVSREVIRAAEADGRVTYQFGFVPDVDLAREIGEASLCVFPYRELHSSGAILVALSLSRPILVPRTTTTEALQGEVGSQWVRIYESLDGAELDAALRWSHEALSTGSRPDLSDRSWQLIRERHKHVTLSVVGSPANPRS